MGDFPNPWASAREEIKPIKDGIWFPSTDDFIVVERNSGEKKSRTPTKIVGSEGAFIYLVLDQLVGSIKRINLITHGNGSRIAFSDEIDTGGNFL